MKSFRSHVLAMALLAACGGSDRPTAQPPSAAAVALVMPTPPADAVPVAAAKQRELDQELVVRGRIAQTVPGRFVFTLMDTSLPFCGEKDPSDKCPTPWDYCCETKATRRERSLLVEARGADGQPIATPSLPDLQLLDVVLVRGRLSADAQGNRVLLASGVHRVERPIVPDYVRWPQ